VTTQGHRQEASQSLQFGPDEEALSVWGIRNLQYVGTATDLAVFDVALNATGGLVHRSLIPFAATRALKTGFHRAILARQ
jgi:hypothetical protein